MKLRKSILLSIFLILVISVTAFATGTYIKDDAAVLSSSTIDQVNTNLGKIESNSGVVVRVVVIKSLGKDSIDNYAANIAKQGMSTDKYAIFVVSVNDHKNKFLVGPGLNAAFNSSDINNIANLPNSDFKSNDFNSGIMKVGKAIDQIVTSKAIKAGDAKVVSNGYSSTVVSTKSSHTGLIIFIILIIIAITIFIIIKKTKKKKKFTESNYSNSSSSNSTFRSTGTHTPRYEKPEPRYEKPEPKYEKVEPEYKYEKTETRYEPSRTQQTHQTHVNNTTVINNNGNRNGYGSGYGSGLGGNGFVEGMIVNEMLHDNHHENHHDSYNDSHNNNRDNDNDNKNATSGDWNLGSGNSDWSNNSDSGSSSWDNNSNDSGSNNDCGSNNDGGSDW